MAKSWIGVVIVGIGMNRRDTEEDRIGRTRSNGQGDEGKEVSGSVPG